VELLDKTLVVFEIKSDFHHLISAALLHKRLVFFEIKTVPVCHHLIKNCLSLKSKATFITFIIVTLLRKRHFVFEIKTVPVYHHLIKVSDATLSHGHGHSHGLFILAQFLSLKPKATFK
jgi:hypothetical protein